MLLLPSKQSFLRYLLYRIRSTNPSIRFWSRPSKSFLHIQFFISRIGFTPKGSRLISKRRMKKNCRFSRVQARGSSTSGHTWITSVMSFLPGSLPIGSHPVPFSPAWSAGRLCLKRLIPIKLNNAFLVIGELRHVKLEENILLPDGFLELDKTTSLCSNGVDAYYSTQLIDPYEVTEAFFYKS